jgi:hypothetical protein
MDDNTRAVHEFLIAMRPVREALGEFVRELYKRPEVKLATEYHPLAYQSSDFGISVDLRSGAGLDFWIELEARGDLWEVTFSIQKRDRDEDGTHNEADFPLQKIQSAVDMPGAILAASEALRQRSTDDTLFR